MKIIIYEDHDALRHHLTILLDGYSYKGIASECFISMDTVSTHLRHIYTKLHVNCATAAVAKAIKERLI